MAYDNAACTRSTSDVCGSTTVVGKGGGKACIGEAGGLCMKAALILALGGISGVSDRFGTCADDIGTTTAVLLAYSSACAL